jgi:hypothetical protein
MSAAPITTLSPEMREVLDRLRRIETRVTRFLETQGFDTQVQRPKWDEATHTLYIPSMGVSLRDILLAIPPQRSQLILVKHKGDLVCTLHVPDTDP